MIAEEYRIVLIFIHQAVYQMPRYPLFVAGKNAEGKVIYYDLLQSVFLLHFRVPWGNLPQASRGSEK